MTDEPIELITRAYAVWWINNIKNMCNDLLHHARMTEAQRKEMREENERFARAAILMIDRGEGETT